MAPNSEVLPVVLGVIPARYASTRFPGKPLADINGKSMIRRVYEQAIQASSLSEVVVATDDERIFRHVTSWGGKVEMTDAEHPTGTDRVAEIACRRPEVTHIINVQGDEPYLPPVLIDRLVAALLSGDADAATLAHPISDLEDWQSPNVVKLVMGKGGEVRYFSRAPIPFVRDESKVGEWLSKGLFLRHIGMYGYKREALMAIGGLPFSPLEASESLEQLRWLEAGWRIVAAICPEAVPRAVDTVADWQALTGQQTDVPLLWD